LGKVAVKEASILIITCSPHRGDALKSIAWIMDEFKARVPIWKKEHYETKEAIWKANQEAICKGSS
jgi:molybdopterin synthase catalytic subunit